jgi:hypothetical protein
MDFRLAPLGCAEQVLDRDPGRLRTEARFGKSFWWNFGRAKDFPRTIRFEPSIALKGSAADRARIWRIRRQMQPVENSEQKQ